MQSGKTGRIQWGPLIGFLFYYFCAAFGAYSPHSQRDCPFEFVNLQDMNLVMSCPAHAHGTLEEAADKLRKLVAEQPEGRKSSVWVCRANQLNTLEVIGPLADNMLLNTMAFTSDVPPEPNEVLWPGFDHPFVNRIRLLRKVPNTRNLYAVINLTGDFTPYFDKRRPSFEEIRWMTLAVIGCDFQGINWRNHQSACVFMDKIQVLEEQVLAYKDDLGKSIPVNWVKDNRKIPVSARASKSFLLVTVLDPDYFQTSDLLNQVSLPISMEPQAGQLRILLPDGISVSLGKTLSGRELNLNRNENQILVDYSFYGGGELMVFQLQGDGK